MLALKVCTRGVIVAWTLWYPMPMGPAFVQVDNQGDGDSTRQSPQIEGGRSAGQGQERVLPGRGPVPGHRRPCADWNGGRLGSRRSRRIVRTPGLAWRFGDTETAGRGIDRRPAADRRGHRPCRTGLDGDSPASYCYALPANAVRHRAPKRDSQRDCNPDCNLQRNAIRNAFPLRQPDVDPESLGLGLPRLVVAGPHDPHADPHADLRAHPDAHPHSRCALGNRDGHGPAR